MGVIIKKQKGIHFTGIGKLAIVGFIVALASAIIDTIWAVYLDSFLHNISLVGFISAGLTVISFFSYFIFIPLVEKIKKSTIYFLTLIAMAITYILFAINTKFYFLIVLAFVITILITLRITSFGIIIKDKSSEKQLSRNEGLMYSFWNVAWVIGPLIAGYISDRFGIRIIFVLAAIFILIAFLIFRISKINDANIKKKTDTNLIKNFLDFFKDKNRVKAYVISGGVNLWWILIYLFMPLYIIRQGLHTLWIGYFLFAVAVPLIMLEFPFAKLAGKTGFRKIFKIGFLIPALCAVTCFFIENVYVVLGLLAFASVGLAILEPTTEAYFFDVSTDGDEPRFYGPYNTTIEINQFIGKIFSAILLIFLPFRYIFLLFGAFMLFFVFLSFKIKDVIENKKKR